MPISRPAIRRLAQAYAISIAIWVPIGVLTGWQAYGAYQGAHVAVSLQAMVLLQTVRYFIVALLTPPLFYCVDRWPVTSTNIRRAAVYVAGTVPFTLVFVPHPFDTAAATPGGRIELGEIAASHPPSSGSPTATSRTCCSCILRSWSRHMPTPTSRAANARRSSGSSCSRVSPKASYRRCVPSSTPTFYSTPYKASPP